MPKRRSKKKSRTTKGGRITKFFPPTTKTKTDEEKEILNETTKDIRELHDNQLQAAYNSLHSALIECWDQLCAKNALGSFRESIDGICQSLFPDPEENARIRKKARRLLESEEIKNRLALIEQYDPDNLETILIEIDKKLEQSFDEFIKVLGEATSEKDFQTALETRNKSVEELQETYPDFGGDIELRAFEFFKEREDEINRVIKRKLIEFISQQQKNEESTTTNNDQSAEEKLEPTPMEQPISKQSDDCQKTQTVFKNDQQLRILIGGFETDLRYTISRERWGEALLQFWETVKTLSNDPAETSRLLKETEDYLNRNDLPIFTQLREVLGVVYITFEGTKTTKTTNGIKQDNLLDKPSISKEETKTKETPKRTINSIHVLHPLIQTIKHNFARNQLQESFIDLRHAINHARNEEHLKQAFDGFSTRMYDLKANLAQFNISEKQAEEIFHIADQLFNSYEVETLVNKRRKLIDLIGEHEQEIQEEFESLVEILSDGEDIDSSLTQFKATIKQLTTSILLPASDNKHLQNIANRFLESEELKQVVKIARTKEKFSGHQDSGEISSLIINAEDDVDDSTQHHEGKEQSKPTEFDETATNGDNQELYTEEKQETKGQVIDSSAFWTKIRREWRDNWLTFFMGWDFSNTDSEDIRHLLLPPTDPLKILMFDPKHHCGIGFWSELQQSSFYFPEHHYTDRLQLLRDSVHKKSLIDQQAIDNYRTHFRFDDGESNDDNIMIPIFSNYHLDFIIKAYDCLGGNDNPNIKLYVCHLPNIPCFLVDDKQDVAIIIAPILNDSLKDRYPDEIFQDVLKLNNTFWAMQQSAPPEITRTT